MQDLTKSIDDSYKKLLNSESKKSYFHAMDSIKTVLTSENPHNEECLKQLDKITQVFSKFYNATGEPARVLDECTIETLQNIIKDERYKNLNDKDKKILELAALFNCKDKDNNNDLALDAHSLSQMLGFTEEESTKLYSIILCQNMLKSASNEEVLQDMSFKLRKDNTFKMTQILTSTSLKSEKEIVSEKLMEDYINYIQSTAIPLPQTRIPRASQLKAAQGVEEVEINGIKNKIIHMNQNPDLENIGFDKNTTQGNFYELVHAFDNDNGDLSQVKYKARKLDAVKNIEIDALLSTSFIKSDDYRVFRHHGVILDVDYNNIGAAYYNDFCSGCGKDEKLLENEYIFGKRNEYRNYISNKLKEKLGYNDSQYIDFINKIQDCKSITDIEKIDQKAAEAMQKLFSEMENGKRQYGRQYNEVLVLNPKIQGVFAYDENVEQIPEDLRKFANEKDLPIIIFGTPSK